MQRDFRRGTLLAMALAAGLAGWGAARAQSPAEETGEEGRVMTVLDPGAKSVVEANLKAGAQKIVVTRFAAGCKATPGGAAALDPQLLDKLQAQLSKRLGRKVSMTTQASVAGAPLNALVMTGCITRFEAGSAAKRMIGMNMGASRLAAHVRVSQKLRTGLRPVAEVDVAVKGANFLPPLSPIGAAVRVATTAMKRQTLAADAPHLGNRIAEAFAATFGLGEY